MVILLVLAVVGGVWWSNTRHLDFLTPPSEAKLEAIRIRVESSLPRDDQTADAISVPVAKVPEPPPVAAEPEMDLGDLMTPPTLQSYGELTPQGAAHLIDLATGLEKKGEFQRALLAWERVVDLTPADAAQIATSISSIKRLRPTLPEWNSKPEAKIQITLHAGTGKKQAATLTPILEGVARDLEAASSGIVKVTATVTAGKTSTTAKGPTPVALWLAGPDKKSPATETLSFTVDSPDDLRGDILKTVFQLIRSHLSRATKYTPPAALAAGEDPQGALNFRVTRLCWSEFAAALNLPQVKAK
jgi:hypothetical protein